MSPQFSGENAIKITQSQYNMMKDVVEDFCQTHEAPKLYGILARVRRRMKQVNNPHLWHTEYDYFATSMLQGLKESDHCRLDDSLKDIEEIFQRQNNNSMPGHNRFSDKSQIMNIFG